jgi:hypothetical protein
MADRLTDARTQVTDLVGHLGARTVQRLGDEAERDHFPCGLTGGVGETGVALVHGRISAAWGCVGIGFASSRGWW